MPARATRALTGAALRDLKDSGDKFAPGWPPAAAPVGDERALRGASSCESFTPAAVAFVVHGGIFIDGADGHRGCRVSAHRSAFNREFRTSEAQLQRIDFQTS